MDTASVTITTIELTAKELAKTFVYATAISAGTIVGFALAGYAVDRVKTRRNAKKTPTLTVV